MSEHNHKLCNYCKRTFSPQQLAEDPEVRPIGMVYDDEIGKAYYMFQHESEDCGTSFTVNIRDFDPLLEEKIPELRMTLCEGCEEHCVNIKDLQECSQNCEFAPFRRFLLKMIAQKRERLAQRAAELHA